MSLVLSRQVGRDYVVVMGPVLLKAIRVNGSNVRFALDAHPTTKILRLELVWDGVQNALLQDDLLESSRAVLERVHAILGPLFEGPEDVEWTPDVGLLELLTHPVMIDVIAAREDGEPPQ